MPISLDRIPDTPQHRRQIFLKRLAVFVGFLVVLALLIGNALVVRHELGIQIANQDWVAHTQEVLLQLERTKSVLTDAETGQRGYLFTGDPKYLEPYNHAIGKVDPVIDSLARLTVDNPGQQTRIPVLRSLAHDKLAELAQTISLFRTGKAGEATALVRSGAGLIAMEKIRGMIAVMETEETSLDTARAAAYQRSIRVTVTCIYLASAIAVIGLVLLACFVVLEIQHREHYLHEIRRREEWYRVTLTGIGDAVIATNQLGKVTFLNPIAENLIGMKLAEARGREIVEVFPIFNELTSQPVQNPVEKVIEQGRVIGLANHTVLRRPDGTVIPIEDSAAPIHDDLGRLIGVVLVFQDVSKVRKSLDVLRKTEKLAAAARLAASVAHEINNPLEAVVNLIYLAKSSPDAPVSVIQSLTLAEQELARVAHLTRQTLGFYRESNSPELVEIPSLIESVLTLYANKFKAKNISIECQFEPCPPLRCVPGEVKQVVANLVSNAADAVHRGGTIKVRTWCIDDGEDKLFHLVVEDDGPGIAPEHVDQIFEPFFTTKKDVGTGLGLWVTKEIVSRHGGSIQVGSRNNGSNGAIFTVKLPCSADIPAVASEHA